MSKSKSEGYKLARKFMNAKDIFKVVNNLKKVGYTVENKKTIKGTSLEENGYKDHLEITYLIGNSHFAKMQVYYKNREKFDFEELNDGFLHDVQITYEY